MSCLVVVVVLFVVFSIVYHLCDLLSCFVSGFDVASSTAVVSGIAARHVVHIDCHWCCQG